MEDRLSVSRAPPAAPSLTRPRAADIIPLLIVGVVLLVIFVFWERFLERTHAAADAAVPGADALRQRWWTPPPLMPVSIWTRARGKLAVMLVVAFLEWCSFNAFNFWIMVRRRVHPRGARG